MPVNEHEEALLLLLIAEAIVSMLFSSPPNLNIYN